MTVNVEVLNESHQRKPKEDSNVKRVSKWMRRSVILAVVIIGMVAWTQYGLSSSTRPKEAGKTLVVMETEGEWLEFIGNAVIISQVSPEQAKPTTLPYVYLSKNWNTCVEYTRDAPNGRACSEVFDQLLKNAERFDVKNVA